MTPDLERAVEPAPELVASVRNFVSTDYGKVVAAVTLATRDREHAEDAVQDAVVKMLDREFEPDNVAAWVTTVAINNVRMVHRRRATEQRSLERAADQVMQDLADPERDVDLHRAVAGLPDRQRSIVALHYYLDMPVAEVASALQISEGTVKTHLHRARGALAKALEGQGS